MPEREVSVRIRNLAVGGAGVGEVFSSAADPTLMGITAFVPFTIPGEEVSALVEEQKRNYLKAKLEYLEQSSSDRVEPGCKYFGVCGGCELQHIDYERQLELKREMIRGALRAARLPSPVLEKVEQVVESIPYRYRRKVTLHIDTRGEIGFYESGSRKVVAIDSCEIALAPISSLLPKLRELGVALAGRIGAITLEADEEGIVATLQARAETSEKEAKELAQLCQPVLKNVRVMTEGKVVHAKGREYLKLKLGSQLPQPVELPAGSFSQVNWAVNTALIQAIQSVIQTVSAQKVHDLYAGAGNFAIPLAYQGIEVVAVEVDPILVNAGKRSAKSLQLDRRLQFIESSVERFLKSEGKQLQTVIADPPRSGLGALTRQLGTANKLFLVSCQLPSMVRDVSSLLDEGWALERIQPFDMFAQSSHIEILSIFHRD